MRSVAAADAGSPWARRTVAAYVILATLVPPRGSRTSVGTAGIVPAWLSPWTVRRKTVVGVPGAKPAWGREPEMQDGEYFTD
jgi:hypothetical protein